MSIERTYYCEAPDCHGGSLDSSEKPPYHVQTGSPPPYLPAAWIETRQMEHGEPELHHFCSWDCCMKYAALQPVPEVVE